MSHLSGESIPQASSSSAQESRPEAAPLPIKRGEIGFNPELHRNVEGNGATNTDVARLPARHPADRDTPPLPSDNHSTDTPTPAVAGADRPTAAADTVSTRSKRTFISFLTPKHNPTYGGIRLTTIITASTMIMLMCGTIAAWVLTVKRLNTATDSDGASPLMTALVFIHVLFAVVVLAQLIVLERWVFMLRAERYAYLHPGEMLPTFRRSPSNENAIMGFAPWNRPPIPSYAAALAASGLGTGDVEDSIIAAPPPPAYGNTRGSTLILSGFLRDSLRVQREDEEDRPKSYASYDEEWEVIRNAERANNLEQTLARLEEGNARSKDGRV